MVASTVRMSERLSNSRWPLWGVALWLPLAAALATVAFVIYAAVQQDIRQSANEPQVTLAESAAERLSAGQTPASLAYGDSVDLRTSLSPFLVIYDRGGNVLASTASLDGHTPELPAGVFAAVDSCAAASSVWSSAVQAMLARLHGERPCAPPGWPARPGELRFTWQPAPGVRAASVLTSYNGPTSGYALAGRSLRETELLEDHIFELVAIGLALGLFVTLVASLASAALVAALRR